MPLSEFKVIYLWEWGHRLLARLVGLVCVIPLIIFYFMKKLSKPVIRRSVLISILIGIFGQLGDFFESMIKRNYKIKDSSNLLLGHGGFLDRFDSIIISSPLIFIFLRFIS